MTTRRELRHAATTRRQRRLADRRAERTLRTRRGAALASVAVLALTIATVSVGFDARDTAVAQERATVSMQERARAAALTQRADAAMASRLAGEGQAYALRTREDALTEARTAVAAADKIQDTATAVLAPKALAPFDEARRALAALTAGLSPGSRATSVVTVSLVGHAATGDAADGGGPAPSGTRSVGPVLDSDASSVSRSAAILRSARELTSRTAEVRVAAADAAADRDRRAAEAAAVTAADLARRVAAAAGAPNGRIPPDVLCGVSFAPDVHLRCDAAAALDALDTAFHATHGGHLVVVSSYRDLAGQVEVKAARGDLASTPGTSNHGRGLAVDLAGLGAVDDFAEPAFLWLKEHAAMFGWTHPAAMEPGGDGPLEPWHWEFGTA